MCKRVSSGFQELERHSSVGSRVTNPGREIFGLFYAIYCASVPKDTLLGRKLHYCKYVSFPVFTSPPGSRNATLSLYCEVSSPKLVKTSARDSLLSLITLLNAIKDALTAFTSLASIFGRIKSAYGLDAEGADKICLEVFLTLV